MSVMKALDRYISDLHFGDEKVARLRGFSCAEEHDDAVIATWRRSVPGDHVRVHVVGDVSKGGRAAEDRAFEILAGLPGEKVLYPGNHCRTHPMHSSWVNRMAAAMEVFTAVQIHGQVRIDGHKVMVSHLPYSGDHEHTGERYTQWRLRDEGLWLICGHVHDEWAICGKQINVGYEHWGEHFATTKDIIRVIREAEAAEVAALGQNQVARASGLLLSC